MGRPSQIVWDCCQCWKCCCCCAIKDGKRVGTIIEGTHTPLNHPWLFMVGALLTRMVVVVEGLGARGVGWGGWWNHTPSRVLSCLCLSEIGCYKKRRRRKKETIVNFPTRIFFSPLSLRVQPTSSLIGCLSVHVCLIIGAALQFGHKHEDTVTLGQHRTNSITSLPHDTAL